jgi:alpha-L-rhamnosidase
MLSLVCLAITTAEFGATLNPVYLRCEYLVDPVGIGVQAPRLSWKLKATSKDAHNLAQSSYRVLVASNPDTLKEGKADLWDSGKQESSDSTAIIYSGKTLTSNQACWWKVKVWDREGKASDWSKPAKWSMGLLNRSDWTAKWIGNDDPLLNKPGKADFEGSEWIWAPGEGEQAPVGTRFFRTTFKIETASNAKISITADDQYTVYVNGQKVAASDGQFDSWRRPMVLPLKRFVTKGDNTIAIAAKNTEVGRAGLIVKATGFKLQTSADWKASSIEVKGWQNPTFEDNDWKAAESLGGYGMEPWGKIDYDGLFIPPPRLLRKEFALTKSIKRATMYCSALGMFDVRINGKAIHDDYFMPGWSTYEKRVYALAYDVTKQVKKGRNAITVSLGDGWYAGYVGFGHKREHYGDQTRYLGQLIVEYTDGSSETIATDGSWKTGFGPTLEADFLMGESYDARRELPGWDKNDFNDSKWKAVDVTDSIEPPIDPFPAQPVRAFRGLQPKSITQPQKGVWVFDLGQNMAGVACLKIKGAEGQKVTLRFAERLNPDGTIYTTNLRSARCIDTYICKGGDKEEVWTPKFTFHGFQYIEVTGLTKKPTKDLVTGIALSSDTPVVGTFECSDPMINKLWSNAWWTQRMNFIDIPTDCPQRDERLGWTGDAQAYIRTAALNTDVHAFFLKWLVALDDSQRADGQFPTVAPVKVSGGDGGPAWADAGVICPWAIYTVYGDKQQLAEHYPAMKKFIEFCKNRSTAELLPPENFHCFGDWLSINADTPKEVIYEAYFALSTQLTAEAARVLGKTEDAEELDALHAKIVEAFNNAYVSEDGRVKGDTQCAYILALGFDLVSGEKAKKAAQYLVEDIEKRGNLLSTGFVGTRDIMHVLAKIGRYDVAYKLLHATDFPSWGFTIKNGATSIWERWNGWTPETGFADPGMNSFAHYAFGAVIQWVYEHVGGIQVGKPGYETFTIKPDLDPNLTWAKTSFDSIRGMIATDWKLKGSQLTLNVTVPANTSATVYVPTSEPSSVTINGKSAKAVRTEKGFALFEVGSGSYTFVSKK